MQYCGMYRDTITKYQVCNAGDRFYPPIYKENATNSIFLLFSKV